MTRADFSPGMGNPFTIENQRIQIMFGLFKSDPRKKLSQTIERKRREAVTAQRSGDLRTFASLTAEIETLEDELISLNSDT